MLRLELEVLAEENFDLDLLGLDEKQLAEVLAREAPTTLTITSSSMPTTTAFPTT